MKYPSIRPAGPKVVSGHADPDTAQLLLTRDDGSTDATQVYLFTGTFVDNGDGTYTINPGA